MSRFLYASLAFSVLGSAVAFGQSVPPSLSHRELSNLEPSAPSAPERSVSAAGGEQSIAPKAKAEPTADAAPDAKQHRLRDPKSGCTVIDLKGLPVDAIAWTGDCTDGLASGKGTITFTSHGKLFEALSGDFDQGKVRDGQADMKWADGSTYSGDVVAAQMDGVGLLTTAEGDRFQGQWATDRLNGHGVVAWANGDHYDGEWRDGKADGHGVQIWSDGRKYDGEWRNDLPNGHGQVTRKDGSRYEGNFLDGHAKDVVEIAAAALPAASTPVAVPAIVAAPAVAESAVAATGLDELAGKKLSAVDGSTLAFAPNEGGWTREIAEPGGGAKKTFYAFLSAKLGTVYESADKSSAVGVFRITDSGVATDYADGRSEILTLNGANGMLMALKAPSGPVQCTVWYPEGHVFSAEDRKIALAEYASRLGLQAPHEKKASVPSACSIAALKPATRPAVQPAPSRSHTHGKVSALSAASPVAHYQIGSDAPILVPTAAEHLIDADASGVAGDSKTIASNGPAAGADADSASACLRVESDGRHWGFRNRCDYDVQFAYCLVNGGNPLTACGQGAVSGSVAANGMGALIADQGLKDTDADHDFRWVACGGGAGEVVAHLDRIDPPTGRCVRPGAS